MFKIFLMGGGEGLKIGSLIFLFLNQVLQTSTREGVGTLGHNFRCSKRSKEGSCVVET